MRKSRCEKVCTCGKPLVMYGKSKDGRQKYKCKSCNKIITETVAYKMERKPYQLFNLLYSIIKQPNINPLILQQLFSVNLTTKGVNKLNNIYFSALEGKKSEDNIICQNPKLLISLTDNNDLIIYTLPVFKRNKEGNRTYNILDKKDFLISPESNPHRYLRYMYRTRKPKKKIECSEENDNDQEQS